MNNLRAIVVDDELLAREGLTSDLERLGVHVVAACGDGYSARAAIAELRPDILFLDVEMPELNGFAMLEGLEPEDIPPAVIFVTAYDQHALRAFEARALDYLLKPIAPERLREAVQRGEQRVNESRALRDAAHQADAESGAAPTSYLMQIIIRDRDQVTIVPVLELEWIEAETYYVRIHARNARPRLLRERMSVLESRLDPAVFFRSHRSAIIRLDLVRGIKTTSRYEHSVVLSTGAHAPLSRDRRVRLEALLAAPSAVRATDGVQDERLRMQ
jgi:two-component system, LytTR family, response regulator